MNSGLEFFTERSKAGRGQHSQRGPLTCTEPTQPPIVLSVNERKAFRRIVPPLRPSSAERNPSNGKEDAIGRLVVPFRCKLQKCSRLSRNDSRPESRDLFPLELVNSQKLSLRFYPTSATAQTLHGKRRCDAHSGNSFSGEQQSSEWTHNRSSHITTGQIRLYGTRNDFAK